MERERRMLQVCLVFPCSIWQWGAGQRQKSQWVSSSVCSAIVSVALALAAELRTSPKSPPAGLLPPTLDWNTERAPTKHSSYLACQTCLTVQDQYICASLISLFNKAAFPGLGDLHNILKTNTYISGRKHSPAD